MSHPITSISRNTSIYRGFVINFRRRTAVNLLNRYEVFLGEQSFGLFDSQAQATGFINQLYTERETGVAA
ncbi:TPA: hypothetical protein ACJIYU_001874 [Yersinia enterocolitica]|uniref:hypothetical protein n=1 Tax=Yersinia enterocolitica TaxID=630 RepID=UPI0021E8EE73|nr:hypothetical protein [Yersinia enterocolitica]UYK06130.1 hypothetical protein N4218_21855 [Yersinia enterocolitica]HDL6706054.1 hypothetical protein [Yersinia enterocolitica]HDL8468872.1 hypothetical protein [Yersinia enterocolitica]HEI6707465.1 hypothetical protein [Yersinia enterocolitica]HEN3235816.1 hypothetical protein [Yersinia enterocolitica]